MVDAPEVGPAGHPEGSDGQESAVREVTGSRQSHGRTDPEADAGAAHEYWAQQDTRRDGGPTFGGFDAGFGPRA